MPEQPAFVAELSRVWRTPQFWVVIARQSIPVIGVAFFDWAALQIGAYFVLQSWLMLSLYCATDLTFDPKYQEGKPPRNFGESLSALIKMLFGALFIVGIMIGLCAAFILLKFFSRDAVHAFVTDDWHENGFLFGLAAMATSCLFETVRFVRSLPSRSPAQIEADDMRIATTFYRVVLLFVACALIGAVGGSSLGDLLFVLAIALIMAYFEALPRSAALLIRSVKG